MLKDGLVIFVNLKRMDINARHIRIVVRSRVIIIVILILDNVCVILIIMDCVVSFLNQMEDCVLMGSVRMVEFVLCKLDIVFVLKDGLVIFV